MRPQCPQCQSTNIISLNSAQHICSAAKAINRLIISNLSPRRKIGRNTITFQMLEELSAKLFEALDVALKLKYQPHLSELIYTHVCLRCGGKLVASNY